MGFVVLGAFLIFSGAHSFGEYTGKREIEHKIVEAEQKAYVKAYKELKGVDIVACSPSEECEYKLKDNKGRL